MKIFKYILLMLCLYIYIYNPIFQILGFGLIKLLLLISLVYVFFNSNKYIDFFWKFKTVIFFTFLIAFYAALTEVWGDNLGRIAAYRHIIWFLESFFIPMFFLSYFKDVFCEKSWVLIIVFLGSFASLVTLYLILNPSLNVLVRSSVIIDSLDVVNDGDWDFRGFTIAEGASYSYGVVQGLILAFCLIKSKESWLYMLPVLPLFISIIFNARVGLAPVALAFVLMLFNGQLKVKYFFFFSLVFIAGYWFVNDSSFAKQNSDSLEWGLSIFEDTSNFLSGKDNNSNYTALSEQMLFFPEKAIHVIFGEGRDIFLGVDKNSDMGYVLEIFRGGIIYLLFMLFFLWILFKKSYNISEDKFIPILFILTILIVNFKGDCFFVSNSFIRLFSFYYVYLFFNNKYRNELVLSQEILN
jgi:hypothetical protein